MKVLHTADWHLGATLGTEKRHDELTEILKWLTELIREEGIEALLIAGDVFDSGAPPNSAAELYYNFLPGARDAGVRTVIVTAGNHDSASFLEAPKKILHSLSVQVIGQAAENPDEQIIPLREKDHTPAAAVCAVPYLRDRDIRRAVSGEGIDRQEDRRRAGILTHYRRICARAAELYPGVPLIATGHFYATGGRISGACTLGSLTNISVNELPDNIAYLALGHLHIPQTVGGRENFRYSGSLLPMSFSASPAQREVVVIDTAAPAAKPRCVPIPRGRRMEKISGPMETVRRRLEELKKAAEPVWVQVENTGPFNGTLHRELYDICKRSAVKVISCANRESNPALGRRKPGPAKKLSELNPREVFMCLLDRKNIAGETREQLLAAFREAEKMVYEEDVNA